MSVSFNPNSPAIQDNTQIQPATKTQQATTPYQQTPSEPTTLSPDNKVDIGKNLSKKASFDPAGFKIFDKVEDPKEKNVPNSAMSAVADSLAVVAFAIAGVSMDDDLAKTVNDRLSNAVDSINKRGYIGKSKPEPENVKNEEDPIAKSRKTSQIK